MMENKNTLILLGGILVVVILGAYIFTREPAPIDTNVPVDGNTNTTATTSTSSVITKPVLQSFVLSNIISLGEVKNWQLAGSSAGTGRAREEIKKLEAMIGKGEFSNYELYVSIAAQHEILGDGKKTYEYLEKALQIDNTQTGLAWHNMGRLMERLGAYKNARIALERAVTLQPLPGYYIALIDLLERHFPEDTSAIDNLKESLGQV
jgi:tetratricopeptide (TPR) repeat protein